jgi:hypothetical protein
MDVEGGVVVYFTALFHHLSSETLGIIQICQNNRCPYCDYADSEYV